MTLVDRLLAAANTLSPPEDDLCREAADEIERLQDQRRDLFAAAALAGYCANPEFNSSAAPSRAVWCRDDADAMIAELDRSKP